MSVQEKKQKQLKDALGNEFSLDFKDVTTAAYNGGQILLPEGMSLSEGIWWLMLTQKNEETVVAINERIEGYPIDVAYALQLAVAELFGIRELRNSPNIFEDNPPTFIRIPVDATGNTVEVFLGRFAVPRMEGYLETSRDYNDALWIRGQLKQKSLPILRILIAKTKELLRSHSLYKGKAFRVKMEVQTQGFEQKVTMANPEFIDVSKIPAHLMLNQDTEDLLTAGLWTPIERSEQCRYFKVALKRGVLLEGPYGSGKSLTAYKTARKAAEHGWTFILLEDAKDLKRIYPVAARWAPCIVFAEDIDLVVKHEDDNDEDAVNMLNNVLDGIESKDKEVIVVLTTNHVDKLPPSLLRAKRFDLVVKYELPDRATAARLVQQYAGDELDIENFDAEEIGDVLSGNQPATIHEIITRAKLFAQQRYPKEYRGNLKLSTRDIILSNKSMQEHLALLNKTTPVHPSGFEQFGKVMGDSIVDGIGKVLDERGREESDTVRRKKQLRAEVPAEKNLVGNSH